MVYHNPEDNGIVEGTLYTVPFYKTNTLVQRVVFALDVPERVG